MGWKTLTLDFDKSKPVTKFRFDVGTPLHYTNGNNYFFSELPNIDANGKNWDKPSGATWGYAKENRGALTSRRFSNRQGGFTDRYWSATTLVETDIYEYDLTTPLYWAGMTEYTNQLAVADLALIKVWVDNVIELDVESLTIPASGGTSNVVVTSENGWTATKPAWITLSPSTGGTGNTTVSVSAGINNDYKSRTGEVVFTDGVDSVILKVKQGGGGVPLKNLYQGENSVKMMIRNGEKIYQQFTRFVFEVDKDRIEFPASGDTDTLTITANENWTMVVPSWLTASAVSGRSSATITLTSQPTEETLEGDIVITCNGVQKTVSVTAGVHDYSKDYLTIEALEDGVYNVTGSKNQYYYSINGGEWVATQIETYDPVPITLQTGDIVRFKGNNPGEGLFWRTNKKFNIYGNPMSLQYLDDFKDKTSYKFSENNFHGLCYQSGVVDAGNLVLSVLNLGLGSQNYSNMFDGCANLTKAPVLPATTIGSDAYREMFKGCTKLNYVKCLATTSTKPGWDGVLSSAFWLQHVSATGTFVKAAGANWKSGISGIPSGWTVIEE